ncbi:MAG: DUF4157 domain-containing protein [Pirellulales bacterium]
MRSKAAISTTQNGPLLQRKCDCGSKSDGASSCPKKCGKDEDSKLLQRKATSDRDVGEVPPIVYDVLRSPGQPLGAETREFFEARFGHDFSRVRVHTNSTASRTAEAVGAHAFTLGNQIVFGEGQYSPSSDFGVKLLGHELTHTLQQRNVQLSTSDQLSIGSPSDESEQEADKIASTIADQSTSLMGTPLRVLSNSSLELRRFASPEHQDIGGRYLDELLEFLQTEEGQAWAKQDNLDAKAILESRAQDPLNSANDGNGKIRLRPEQVLQSDGKIRIQNRSLSAGDVIALMGDFAESVEELEGRSSEQTQAILEAIDADRSGGGNADARYERVTEGRYSELAKRNLSHFAPENVEKWKTMHLEAVSLAMHSQNDESLYQRALLIDAAAGHFLTDSFAGGHMFDARRVMAAIQVHLHTVGVHTDNPEAAPVVGLIGSLGLVDPALLVLKNIHDWFNAIGRTVRNRRGMEWQAFGDEHLSRSQALQRVVSLAVFLSRMQVVRARSGIDPNLSEVLDLVPLEVLDPAAIEKITQQAIARIPEAVREMPSLIHRNVDILDEVLFPGASNLFPATVIRQATDPGRIRQLEMEQSLRGAGSSASPSMTVPILGIDF